LKNFHLDRFFDAVVASRYAGVAKPSREIFCRALQETGVEASEAIHVGDSYENDYRGALDAGFARAFLIHRHRPEEMKAVPRADVLRDLSDLLPALDLAK